MAEKQNQQEKIPGKAGWSPEETALLFEEIDRAVAQEQPIRRAFEVVAQKTGRRPNSIRNYYYTKLREEPGRGKAAFIPFGEQEQRRLVEAMLLGQAEGKSVRSIAASLGGGERKAMLRYQNKYRGLLRGNPGYIEKVLQELRDAGKLGPQDNPLQKTRRRPGAEQTLAELADNLARLGKDGEAVLYGLNHIVWAAIQKENSQETRLLSQLAVQRARNQELERQLLALREQSHAAFSEELPPEI